jgi:hypothetical protein
MLVGLLAGCRREETCKTLYGNSCGFDCDCPHDLHCLSNRGTNGVARDRSSCFRTCKRDEECGDGTRCVAVTSSLGGSDTITEGECWPLCASDGSCPSSLFCRDAPLYPDGGVLGVCF